VKARRSAGQGMMRAVPGDSELVRTVWMSELAAILSRTSQSKREDLGVKSCWIRSPQNANFSLEIRDRAAVRGAQACRAREDESQGNDAGYQQLAKTYNPSVQCKKHIDKPGKVCLI